MHVDLSRACPQLVCKRSMSGAQPRGKVPVFAENAPTSGGTCTEEDADGDRCSYEEKRNKRVAKMKELMLPLVQASKLL